MAGLRAGEEEEEGTAGAGSAGLPPAAPPGGCHASPAVRSGHEGLPAAATRTAAGAGRPLVPPLPWEQPGTAQPDQRLLAGSPQSPAHCPSLCHTLETESAGPRQGASASHICRSQQESDVRGSPSQQCCCWDWRCLPGDQEATSSSWALGSSGQPGVGRWRTPTPGAVSSPWSPLPPPGAELGWYRVLCLPYCWALT